MSDRKFTEKEIEEMRGDAERAHRFRAFADSAIWKKDLEPFLFKLQQDAETEAVVAFRSVSTPNEVLLRGAVASGRAMGAEMFALFIVRGINDAKESERRLKSIEDANKKVEAQK